MRIAVAGATGNIGARTVATLERDGHEAVRISRSHGIDLLKGDGLDEALSGVDAVIDVTNGPATDPMEAITWFTTVTRNLLAAEERAGVRHHVLLSIACLYRVGGNAHYAAKRAQEEVVTHGPVPWTIVPATQFHDFAAMVAGWTEHDGAATVAPLLLQPVDPGDVAEVLAELAVGEPRGRYADLAGPETQDLVDMARRTHQAQGRTVRLIPTWDGLFSTEMAGKVMLPDPGNVRIAPTTFDQWLATQRSEPAPSTH
ncbi:nucleoside-diphosphate sugar epimerase [Paractinoplanes deccanensis]|uniref:Nucleoside-diphosphate sugar epimerase n=1 Tax=Paractinoplanes deccanensis TaxID=113561 RepID=A0ABQ3Y6B5_9ACTN|nr:SDR family oxidoreductase [Actinoplanes deccanensis]GID75534.1 nucleoside-diphosphate sugar epimerase [Actinoplanes deccanensis]